MLDLKQREDEVARQLRSLCDDRGREIEPSKTAKLIHKLGLIHREKSPDKLALVQAAALFNAAIVREPENVHEIKQDLSDLCHHVLRLAKASKPDADLVQGSLDIFLKVKEMRVKVRSKLKDSPNRKIFESQLDYEKSKIEFTQRLQTVLTKEFLEIMKDLSDFAIRALGEPPCKYCHVGLGSLARKEVTPFSDFESIIVLEEGVQRKIWYSNILDYYRWFTIIFQILILNFGETIIPTVAVRSLNDFSKKDGDWFFDVHTPRGICFDGLMPHASKTPLGRQEKTKKKPWKTELIKPMSEMLQYLTSESDLKNGYHLADVLCTTTYVSGNEDLCDEFRKKVHMFQVNQDSSHLTSRGQLDEDLKAFAVFNSLEVAHNIKSLNTKKMVYRSSTLFISSIGKSLKLKSISCFDIVNELEEKRFTTPQASHNLRFAVAVACDVRLRAYMKNQAQSENISLVSRATDDEKKFDFDEVINTIDILEYFKITYCLQKYIKAGGQEKIENDVRTVGEDVQAKIYFYLFQYKEALECGLRLRDFYSSQSNEDQIILCTTFIKECLFRLERYEEALEESKSEFTKQLHLNNHNYSDLAKSKGAIAKCLAKMGRYLEAGQEFEAEFKIRKTLDGAESPSSETVRSMKDIGDVYFKQGEYAEALEWLFREKIGRESLPQTSNNLFDLSECYLNIGGCYFMQNQIDNALEYYKQAKDLKTRISEREIDDEEVAYCWNKIGHCFLNLQNSASALSAYQEELSILKLCKKTNDIPSRTVDCFANIASCYFNLKNYSLAVNYRQDEYKTRVDLGQNSSLVAACLQCLGDDYFALKQVDDALETYFKELDTRLLSDELRSTSELARCYNSIAGCYVTLKDFKNALKYSQEELSVREKSFPINEISIKNAKHNIATSLHSLKNSSDGEVPVD